MDANRPPFRLSLAIFLPLGLTLGALCAGCGGEEAGAEEQPVPDAGAVDRDMQPGSPDAGPPPVPTPWGVIGFGVNYRTTGVTGNNVFIGYAGYNESDGQSQAWVDALDPARLQALGVGHVYAVRGPADVSYSRREIGNTKLIAHLLARIDANTGLILVAAHSSGAYVANELFGFLSGGSYDKEGKTRDRTVYFNLDGGGGLTSDDVAHLYRTYFVYAQDSRTGTESPNASTMMSQARALGARTELMTINADRAGCATGATWCLHLTLITTKPHSATNSDPLDYSDFIGRPVQTSYLDQSWSQLSALAHP